MLGQLLTEIEERYPKVFASENGFAPHIAVDLDGTLARHIEGTWTQEVGEVIPSMKEKVLKVIAGGNKVKILTARAVFPEQIDKIKVWLKDNGFPELEITDRKDPGMIELWDDRARQVKMNTGEFVNA